MAKLLALIVGLGLLTALAAAPLRVGGNVQQAKLVTKAAPQYPPEAKEKGIEGTVKLQAIIDTDGTVKEVKLLSGPPELVDASITAVKQWVYSTTLLNGKPVQVITDIDVNYKLEK